MIVCNLYIFRDCRTCHAFLNDVTIRSGNVLVTFMSCSFSAEKFWWPKLLFIPDFVPGYKTLYSLHRDGIDPVDLQPENLLRSLQPLVLWMANSIELLHFIHQEVPCLLHGISRMEEEEEEDCMGNYFT